MIHALVFGVALSTAAVQEPSAQKLFESGKLDAVVERVQSEESAPPDQIYWQALALSKLDRGAEAGQAYGRLAQAGDSAWGAIGQSGVALTQGNLDAALSQANTAVEREQGLAQAHYQLGVVRSARKEHAEAAEAFAKAAELAPLMAYAHYGAAMSYYEAKRVDRMAIYFENFLKVAPQAPERPAVQTIMRTVRGR